jgi:hypothetical protein
VVGEQNVSEEGDGRRWVSEHGVEWNGRKEGRNGDGFKER